jgi:hypothetical protein
MKGEQERGTRGRSSQAPVTGVAWTRPSPAQDSERHEVEDHGIGGVQEQAGQVIAAGLQAPEQVVQAEGHPGQGEVVAHVKRGPHPAELGPAEPTILGVVEEILVVVPVHELVVQRRQERGEGDQSDQQRDKPGDPSLGGRAGLRLPRRPERFRGVGPGGGFCLSRVALAAH